MGYRLDDWEDEDRGRLIEQLNDLGVAHRFEEDELVVDASDEERVDDLVAFLVDTGGEPPADRGPASGSGDPADLDDLDGSERDEPAYGEESVAAAVALLASAASRLKADPTDMQADGDVAEASASVFLVDRFGPLNEDQWSAVGRVTRRLLSVLGAEEALEEQIRSEAGVLANLLAPLSGETHPSPNGGGERTVYELPEWLPEQRAQLGVLMGEAGIVFTWEGDELLVPSDREEQVEALFDQVAGTPSGEDDGFGDEARYQAVAELFAATGRLASDPTDEDRGQAVLDWFEQVDGPPLLGMDEVDWLRIMKAARTLVSIIEEQAGVERIAEEAHSVHELLRRVV